MRQIDRILSTIVCGAFLTVAACDPPAPAPDTTKAPVKGSAAVSKKKPTIPVPKPDPGVKFTKKAPKVGAKAEKKGSMNMSLSMALGDKEMKMQMVEKENKSEEVLEVANDAITKLKVTYTEKVATETEGDKEAKEKKSPLNGKTYILVHEDDKTTVMNDKEKPAPKKEADLVLQDYPTFGKPDEFMKAMPTRALKPGDKVPELAEAIKNHLAKNKKDKEEMTVKDVAVVFKGKAGTNGRFSVDMTMAMADKDMTMNMKLKGTLLMRTKDAWPVQLNLAGPIQIGDEKAADAKAGDKKADGGADGGEKKDKPAEKKKDKGLTGKGSMRMSLSINYPA